MEKKKNNLWIYLSLLDLSLLSLVIIIVLAMKKATIELWGASLIFSIVVFVLATTITFFAFKKRK